MIKIQLERSEYSESARCWNKGWMVGRDAEDFLEISVNLPTAWVGGYYAKDPRFHEEPWIGRVGF